ncbi:MAG: hypothetical protein C4523_21415 [Myxococcales bacterium]|nr:MAG: hypothetical protein C4523_21415 [Myxococcales bacterium]
MAALRKWVWVVCAVLLIGALNIVGCGDAGDEADPTDPLAGGGAIDEERCRNACDKVGDCIGSSAYVDECRRQCGQSGYFDTPVLNCIETASCTCTDEEIEAGCQPIFDCGYTY